VILNVRFTTENSDHIKITSYVSFEEDYDVTTLLHSNISMSKHDINKKSKIIKLKVAFPDLLFP
jgi:hypothetical protein